MYIEADEVDACAYPWTNVLGVPACSLPGELLPFWFQLAMLVSLFASVDFAQVVRLEGV